MKHRILVLTAVLIIGCMKWAIVAVAVDTSPEIGDGVSEILSNLIKARSLLNSGEFRAIGHRFADQRSNDPYLSELFCAFDTRSGCFRFDTRGELPVSVLPETSRTPEVNKQIQERAFEPERTRRKTVSIISRNPEYSVEYIAIGENPEEEHHARLNLKLRDPNAPPSAHLSSAFNAPAIGLIEFDRMHLKDMAVEAILERFAHFSSSLRTSVELTHEEENKLQIVYTTGEKYRRVLTIDPSRGFTVTQMRLFELDENGSEIKYPSIESTATWEFKNDVWVPTHFSATTFLSEDTKTGYDYDIDWLSVNPELLDPKLFDYRHFEGIWKGTHVFDGRNGQAEYIETIDDINLKDAGLLAPTRNAVPIESAPNAPRMPVVILIVVNVFAVLLLMLFYVRRQRRLAADSRHAEADGK